METALRILGDGLSIAALTIIATTAHGAWKRIPAGTSVPIVWTREGKPALRLTKAAGLLWIPVASMAIIFAFTLSGTTFRAEGLEAVMVFCVRATLGAVLAMAQLFHLRSVIKTLQDEGQL
ncbi:hypothetical protein OVA11_03600 [Caulobacter sp. SL161]|uniref:hypothetical protein n=1 Tax=Caulobacter sp. SL161 TaxID=2995156 RepID=UPI002275E743|nr:hypothetical protein [Caulobacter sp. SL161]MCY1646183.1 hypothetical protein [Caulobacter sp. SL161]